MELIKGTATLVLGLQYGDEGKGKLVDVYAQKSDLVCRVHGGNNAGHTIWVDGKKIVTQLMPSGILHEHCQVALGAGVVVNPLVLRNEIENIRSLGYRADASKIHVDYRCPVILPAYKRRDGKLEAGRSGAQKIGTTGQGIGPAYAGRSNREIPRVAELIDEKLLRQWIKNHPQLAEEMTASEIDEFVEAGAFLRPYVKDVAMIAHNTLHENKKLLIEGAQGTMLDVAFGSYPYVTSSQLVAGACAGGLGIPPYKIRTVQGVIKAYATRVGNGPFPTEIIGQLGKDIQTKGKEFGSVTGRNRNVGWLDLVALRYFCILNGVTHLALMKSDVLDGIDYVGLVTEYRDKETGEALSGYPMTCRAMENIEPVVEMITGWENVETSGKLIPTFQNFVKFIEGFVNVPINYVSTGPERKEGVWV